MTEGKRGSVEPLNGRLQVLRAAGIGAGFGLVGLPMTAYQDGMGMIEQTWTTGAGFLFLLIAAAQFWIVVRSNVTPGWRGFCGVVVIVGVAAGVAAAEQWAWSVERTNEANVNPELREFFKSRADYCRAYIERDVISRETDAECSGYLAKFDRVSSRIGLYEESGIYRMWSRARYRGEEVPEFFVDGYIPKQTFLASLPPLVRPR